jgi:hypothetical protein
MELLKFFIVIPVAAGIGFFAAYKITQVITLAKRKKIV